MPIARERQATATLSIRGGRVSRVTQAEGPPPAALPRAGSETRNGNRKTRTVIDSYERLHPTMRAASCMCGFSNAVAYASMIAALSRSRCPAFRQADMAVNVSSRMAFASRAFSPKRDAADTATSMPGSSFSSVMGVLFTCNRYRRCERSGRNARVATLQPPQRIPTDKKSGRHIRSGNPALASRNGDVATELAKRMPGGKWKRGVSWHDKYRPEYLTFRQL